MTSIGLFSAATSAAIPADAVEVRTTGYAVPGLGQAFYVADATVDAAFVAKHKSAAFLSQDGRGFRLAEQVFSPEMFGARGDGAIVSGVVAGTNDTDAMAAMSRWIEHQNGGEVQFRPVTYVVGKHLPWLGSRPYPGDGNDDPFAYGPSDIVTIRNVRGKVTLRGNGARLIAAAGLRYGSFSRTTEGEKLPDTQHDPAVRATPYYAMLWFHACTGGVEIDGFELDGRLQSLDRGGAFSQQYQISCGGIHLFYCPGWTVTNCNSHHHGQDGIQTVNHTPTESTTRAKCRIEASAFTHNARQGWSLIGGRGIVVTASSFNHTGRAGFFSAPAAGVDFEGEQGNFVKDVTFTNCEFVDNGGTGINAAAGHPSSRVRFRDSTFVGTSTYSIYLDRPDFHFEDCLIVGSTFLISPSAGKFMADSPTFRGCTFTDNPTLSPTGVVFCETSRLLITINAGSVFERCSINTVSPSATLAYTAPGTLFRDCTFNQAGTGEAVLRGIFEGNTDIVTAGSINGAGSVYRDRFTKNGLLFGFYQQNRGDIYIGAGGRFTAYLSGLPDLKHGDAVIASWSSTMVAGVHIESAQVTNPGSVEVTWYNPGQLDRLLDPGVLTIRKVNA